MKIPLIGFALAMALTACGPKPPTQQPLIEVWKSPTCSCCSKWITHLKDNGFDVAVHNESAMNPLKTKLGVPQNLASCHTGVVDGYIIEGHVPAADIHRLLLKKPAGKGLAVPGMPIGSPGMEQGERQDPYTTILFADDGGGKSFQSHGRQPQ